MNINPNVVVATILVLVLVGIGILMYTTGQRLGEITEQTCPGGEIQGWHGAVRHVFCPDGTVVHLKK